MNAYRVEHKTEYRDNGIDKTAWIDLVEVKHYLDYQLVINYAEKYGCTRHYGNIDDGMVTYVGEWVKDPYYGDNQTQITVTTFECQIWIPNIDYSRKEM